MALVGGEWSVSHPSSFTLGERALGTHWMGGEVCTRAGLLDVDKRKFLTLPGLDLRPLGHQACRHLLYRLHYPGSHSATVLKLLHILQYEVIIIAILTNYRPTYL
jgi:hypothetical protein